MKSGLFISELMSYYHQVMIYWSWADIKGDSSGTGKEITAEGLAG